MVNRQPKKSNPFDPSTHLIAIPFDSSTNLWSKLHKLESIYKSPFPFSVLRHISGFYCLKLRKSPLHATIFVVEELEISMIPQEQKTELECEDQDTKNRLLPSFVQVIISLILFCLR